MDDQREMKRAAEAEADARANQGESFPHPPPDFVEERKAKKRTYGPCAGCGRITGATYCHECLLSGKYRSTRTVGVLVIQPGKKLGE